MNIKQYKKDSDYSYSIGIYPTIELLTYKAKYVTEVFLHTKGQHSAGLQKIIELCRSENIPFIFNNKTIERIAPENTYAIGLFSKYISPIKQGNHVVLVSPSDMGNIGTIIRTMLGFNISNLVFIKPAIDIFHPKTIRASMGGVFQINYMYFDTFEAYSTNYNNNIYTLMTEASKPIQQTHFQVPFSIVCGNEGAGLPQEFLHIGESVRIPQTNAIDSLNVSIALGITLYKATEDIYFNNKTVA